MISEVLEVLTHILLVVVKIKYDDKFRRKRNYAQQTEIKPDIL
jgi:hypothetical protein